MNSESSSSIIKNVHGSSCTLDFWSSLWPTVSLSTFPMSCIKLLLMQKERLLHLSFTINSFYLFKKRYRNAMKVMKVVKPVYHNGHFLNMLTADLNITGCNRTKRRHSELQATGCIQYLQLLSKTAASSAVPCCSQIHAVWSFKSDNDCSQNNVKRPITAWLLHLNWNSSFCCPQNSVTYCITPHLLLPPNNT